MRVARFLVNLSDTSNAEINNSDSHGTDSDSADSDSADSDSADSEDSETPNSKAMLGTAKLCPQETHHLKNVLRLETGSQIEILIRENSEVYLAEVTHRKGPRAEVRLLEKRTPTNSAPLHLIVGIHKPVIADLICEKCVELGASSIHFFLTSSKTDKELCRKRRKRLLRVRDSAIKQSFSSLYTAIEVHSSLAQIFEFVHPDKSSQMPEQSNRLVLTPPREYSSNKHNPEQPPTITQFFSSSRDSTAQPGKESRYQLENIKKSVENYLVIGPEQGLSETECRLAERYLYQAVSLGNTVVRTETAAILSCGLIKLLSGDAAEP